MPFNFRRKPLQVKVPKVLVIDFRPAAVPQDWRTTPSLVEEFIEAMIQASHKTLVYKIVARLDIPKYPVLIDGRQYNDTTWIQALQDDKTAIRDPHGNYMLTDYQHILQEYNIMQGIQSNQIDEVWMFGGPYFGFYESRMVGKGAFWCNAPGVEQNSRRFVMMGFNYQRGGQEMIHSFSHRAESILSRHFGSQEFQNRLYGLQTPHTPKNEYEQWLLDHGTVHRKPGGTDYGQNEFTWASALKTAWWPFIIDPNKVA
jgi:hypothetical protein